MDFEILPAFCWFRPLQTVAILRMRKAEECITSSCGHAKIWVFGKTNWPDLCTRHSLFFTPFIMPKDDPKKPNTADNLTDNAYAEPTREHSPVASSRQEDPFRTEQVDGSNQPTDKVDKTLQFETLIALPSNQDRRLSVDDPKLVKYFGQYEILSEIARGGMGVVYRARQRNLNRVVALKMILSGALASPEDIKRFYTEAEAAASLEHPSIVPIYEVGEHEGQHFFSMAMVDGKSLADRIKSGPLSPHEAAEIMAKVAKAIDYAHGKGVIHRDIKPANILLDPNGDPKITDFGLARIDEVESNLTRTGLILGTPSFMPPEQASGKVRDIGPHSDVYSIGSTLYCLLTGEAPFQGLSPLDTLNKVMNDSPKELRSYGFGIPKDLQTICMKCLEKKPEHRYPSANLLASDLDNFLNNDPITARPPNLLVQFRYWLKKNPRLVRTARFNFAALTMLMVLLVSYLSWQSEIKRIRAEAAMQTSEAAKRDAETARRDAETARRVAEMASESGEKAMKEALNQRELAEALRKEAEKQGALSRTESMELRKKVAELEANLGADKNPDSKETVPKLPK
jgi:serine/threonine protein kinase